VGEAPRRPHAPQAVARAPFGRRQARGRLLVARLVPRHLERHARGRRGRRAPRRLEGRRPDQCGGTATVPLSRPRWKSGRAERRSIPRQGRAGQHLRIVVPQLQRRGAAPRGVGPEVSPPGGWRSSGWRTSSPATPRAIARWCAASPGATASATRCSSPA
jgi:hypothetical protein